MELTNRDIKIINFIDENQGASIEQIQKLFFPSYDVAADRLKILTDNKFLKVQVHPILGKKVYYIKKMPSYHSIVITDVLIHLGDKVKYMEREYKIKNSFVDCIFVLEQDIIIVLEVDIYNKTKKQKIKEIKEALAEANINMQFWVVCQADRRDRVPGIRYIKREDINNQSII